jgi:glucose-1-phosphate thymidylyltransferase
MKAIILAGGFATRLYPCSVSVSKHLLTIYDKPMIYYPLSVVMLSKIKDVLIITTKEALHAYQNLLKDGSHLGINISYIVQEKPSGIAESFIIGRDFIKDSNVCLILGDNIFYGHGLPAKLQLAGQLSKGARIFGYHVKDPERYGVAEVDVSNGRVVSVEEKPAKPKSNYAITGLYFFDNSVVEKANKITPSARGELEITSIMQLYLEENNLSIELLGRGIAWLDTGTVDSLLEASNFISAIEKRQGLKVACLEEIAYNYQYITHDQLANLASLMPKSSYKEYIKTCLVK